MLREGDTMVVWKLDRLGRSLKHLIESVQALDSRGIGFKSLQDNIDTTTPGGKLLFHILGSLAEFERDLIREERTPVLLRPVPEEEWEAGPEEVIPRSKKRP